VSDRKAERSRRPAIRKAMDRARPASRFRGEARHGLGSSVTTIWGESMIVCSTPRCGGTVFCLDKARETGAAFVGELSTGFVKGLGSFGNMKQQNHETGYQPTYSLDEYLSYLQDLASPGRIFLVNGSVSFALPMASYCLATRNMQRAYRSFADLIIRSVPAGNSPEAILASVARFTEWQRQTNLLIRRFCERAGRPLLYFEDRYQSKGSFPHFEGFPLRSRLEAFFDSLEALDRKALAAV